MPQRVPLAGVRGEYLIVLLMIAVSYVFCAIQTSPFPSEVALLVQLVTVAAILRISRAHQRIMRVAAWVLSFAVVATVAAWASGSEAPGIAIALSAASAVAYFVAPLAIVAHQFRRNVIDLQTLLAAICAYILVGMFFTFVYNLVALVSTTPIFEGPHNDSLTSQVFFSFTTLTTTGYGNLVPSTITVQTIAIAEAITGQLFLVIALARVVTGWTPHRPPPPSEV